MPPIGEAIHIFSEFGVDRHVDKCCLDLRSLVRCDPIEAGRHRIPIAAKIGVHELGLVGQPAQRIAEAMSRHRAVRRVYYPGLADSPGHALAREQMHGFGGMLTIEVLGLPAAVEAADVALKTANVQLIGYETTDGMGMVAVKIEGQVSAVQSAVAAARAAAERITKVFAVSVIARPSDQLSPVVLTGHPGKRASIAACMQSKAAWVTATASSPPLPMIKVSDWSPNHPSTMLVASTLMMSPSFNRVSSGIPWQMTSLIDVHMLFGNGGLP